MNFAKSAVPRAAQTMEDQFRAMLERHGGKSNFMPPSSFRTAAPPLSAGGGVASVLVTPVAPESGKLGLLKTILKYAKWITAVVVIITIVVVIYIISKKFFGQSTTSVDTLALKYQKNSNPPPPPEYVEGDESEGYEEVVEEEEEEFEVSEEEEPTPVNLTAEETDPNFTLLADLS